MIKIANDPVPCYSPPDINRFLTVLRGGIPDRVPNYEVLICKKNAGFILGKEVLGHTWELPVDDCVRLASKIGMDALLLPVGGRVPKFVDSKKGVMEKPNLKNWKSDFLDSSRGSFFRLKEAMALAKGTGVGVGASPDLIFDRTLYAFGFERFMITLYEKPTLAEDVMDLYTEYATIIFEEICRYNPVFIHAGDDVAGKTGLFIRPDLFRKIWLPRMRRILERPLRQGIPVIFHSDGNIKEIVPDLLELGFCAVNPVEPYSNDIYKMKREWGDRLTLIGNIDIASMLSFGSEEDVVADVKAHLKKLMPGGRYICSSSHSITDDVKPENFMTMIRTIHEYGRY